MAKNSRASEPNSEPASGDDETSRVDGQADGGGGKVVIDTPNGPVELPAAVRKGRPREKFGRSADARREADLRYAARKAGKLPPAGATVAAAPPTTAGYANELVIWHEEAAEITGIPQLRLNPKRAMKLEKAFQEVMSDRGVELKSPKAHLMSLVFLVALIYVPMLLAVLRKISQVRREQTAMPAPPVNQPQQAPAEPIFSAPGFETVNGKIPEHDLQVFGEGKVAGNYFDTSGQL